MKKMNKVLASGPGHGRSAACWEARCTCAPPETEAPAETEAAAEAGDAEEAEPAETEAAEPAADASAGSGSVYWLNFKPESDEVLQQVAAMYKEKTGVNVKVVTAASGTYSQTLNSEMDKSEAPTIFVIGNTAGAKEWSDYCA